MSEDDKQPVTDKTDDQAKPDAEGNGAPADKKPEDDLESALAEFETQSGSPSPEPKPAAKDPNQERLERLERSLADREYRDDMKTVVTTVRGDFKSDEADDEFIDLWVNAEAAKDARVRQAWLKRHEDPKGFQRVAAGLSRKFAEKYAHLRKRDDDATADRDAVADAVRGTRKSAPAGKAPDLSRMTDAELQKYKESLGM